VSVHIKVHGLEEPHARTWSRKLKEYLELLSVGQSFLFFFRRRDASEDTQLGRLNGSDNAPILRVDGPHYAPSEHYTNYRSLTPCASVLCALTKYRWKKNFNPKVLYFYWIVDGFQWLVHMLTELSYELKKSLQHRQIEKRYYCEIHIYIAGHWEVDYRKIIGIYRNFDGKLLHSYFTIASEVFMELIAPLRPFQRCFGS
jgi:hypothetical protein